MLFAACVTLWFAVVWSRDNLIFIHCAKCAENQQNTPPENFPKKVCLNLLFRDKFLIFATLYR